MGDVDETKGKIKQAAGDLTDNDQLRKEGERDEMAGKAKGMADKVKDKADDAIDAVKDRMNKN